jgi:hypothetical protein
MLKQLLRSLILNPKINKILIQNIFYLFINFILKFFFTNYPVLPIIQFAFKPPKSTKTHLINSHTI